MFHSVRAVIVCTAVGVASAASARQSVPFDEWLTALMEEARGRGYSESLIGETLNGLQPLERVIVSDRSQAEVSLGFEHYLSTRVTPRLVAEGQRRAVTHRSLLAGIERRFGVPRRFLLAIWGVESRYGANIGRVPIFQALATLAWEPRRSEFFRSELFDALAIAQAGDRQVDRMTGSWAGAMGQTQFMPSSYVKHAVDFDGDGRRDIWESVPDALASIAQYLKAHGWNDQETWGREVRVSKAARARIAADVGPREGGCYAMRNMTGRLPLARWRELGIRRADGGALPRAKVEGGLVEAGERTFLVYPNYDALLRYNCAHHYALSVAMLAERIGRR
jgi:membrane-bound lytic murein transglycosylase B